MRLEIEVCDFRYDEGLRSRIEKQILPTLTTHNGGGLSGSPMVMEHERERESNLNMEEQKVRIRKLTPRECYRLMGFDDEDFNKAQKVNSDTQLYKQAGNSIVVNVLCAIFKEML